MIWIIFENRDEKKLFFPIFAKSQIAPNKRNLYNIDETAKNH